MWKDDMTLIEDIVAQVIDGREIPEFITETSQTLIADSVVCTIAGTHATKAPAMRAYLESRSEKSGALTDQDVALGLGFAAHALDFDNSSYYIGHNSAVLVPAALALARGRTITGADLLRAYALGTEASFQIAMHAVPDLNFRGFHITPVFGTLGATIQTGLLLGLTEQQLTAALSLAVSHSSGVMGQFGSAAMYYHCGMAASNAIRSCELALAGLSGNADVLESANGFYRAYAGKESPEAVRLGGADSSEWAMGQFSFLVKMYPCCSAAHAAVEGLKDLVADHAIAAEDVAEIVAEVPEYSIHNLQYTHPATESEARFSMGFALANVLVHGRFDMGSFTDDNLTDPRIRAIEDRVRMDVSGAFPAFVEEEPSILHVRLTDGRELVRDCRYPRGRTLETPASAEDLRRKAHGCFDGHYPADLVDRLVDSLARLDTLTDLNELPVFPHVA